jgi:hypothetical protein
MKWEISPPIEKLPKSIINSDKSASSMNTSNPEVFPTGTVNELILDRSAGLQINEGTAVISQELWEGIYKNGKLMTATYPFVLKKIIQHHINNTCQIVFKYVKYLKNKIKYDKSPL